MQILVLVTCWNASVWKTKKKVVVFLFPATWIGNLCATCLCLPGLAQKQDLQSAQISVSIRTSISHTAQDILRHSTLSNSNVLPNVVWHLFVRYIPTRCFAYLRTCCFTFVLTRCLRIVVSSCFFVPGLVTLLIWHPGIFWHLDVWNNCTFEVQRRKDLCLT